MLVGVLVAGQRFICCDSGFSVEIENPLKV